MNKKTASIIIAIIAVLVTVFLKKKQDEDKLVNEDLKDNTEMSEKSENKTNQSEKITVGFYNVENLFDTYDDPYTDDGDFTPHGDLEWDEYRYQDKINKLASVIADINPAVMGLAEVENYDVVYDLINTPQLKSKGYKIVHEENNDTRGIDVAAIYNPSVFTLVEYDFHRVSGNGNNNTRDFLELKGQFFGQEPIHFFINHWPSRRKGTDETEYKRIALAKSMRKRLVELMDEDINERIIIMGDFNDEPSDESIHKYLMKDDFYNLHRKFEDKNQGTVNHQGDWLVFDQIIVSKSLLHDETYHLTKKSGEIYNKGEVTFTHPDGNTTPNRTYGGYKYFGGYSDHYAVYAKIVVKY
ncbi:MAG: endonuclease/exonuclease/phosphatase family protein [Putridiphycobacter sp.]